MPPFSEQRDFPPVFGQQLERGAMSFQTIGTGNLQSHPPALSGEIWIQNEDRPQWRK